MDQQLPLANIITLGVRDFAREREFYRQLGWPHAFDSDTFTVFEMRGALLALFGVDQLGTRGGNFYIMGATREKKLLDALDLRAPSVRLPVPPTAFSTLPR